MHPSDNAAADDAGATRDERKKAHRDARGAFLPKRFGRGLTAGVVGAILVVGLSASAVLYAQAERIAERQEMTMTVRARRALESVSSAVVAAVGGASAIVDRSGAVEKPTFDSFAAGAVGTTLLPVLAYVSVVDGADRPAFEKAMGRSIVEAGQGSLVPSAERSRYLVVTFVYPETPTSESVLGFDIASEPIRATAGAAAEQSGAIVFSAPLTAQPSGQVGFFAIQPLYRPGQSVRTPEQRRAALAGFVSSLVPATVILAQIREQLPNAARVRITDDGALLAATPSLPHNGHRVTIVEAGRLWTIDIEYHSADYSMAWLLIIATIVLAAAVGAFLWRNVRQTAELREAAIGVRQLGQLSEQLATADSRDEVLAIILSSAASTVGAASVAVAVPSADAAMLIVNRSGQDSRRDYQLVASEPSPMTDAWNTHHGVFVNDEAAFRGLYADGVQDRTTRRVVSVAALPMRGPEGDLLGVLAWEWSSSSRFGNGVRSTLQATAEVCQQSLYRADLREHQWNAASALSALSQRLAVARSVHQIAEAVIALGPAAGGSDYVGVGFLNEAGTMFDVFHPVGHTTEPESTDFAVNSNGALMTVLRRGQPIEFHEQAQLDRFPVLAELMRIEMRRLTCIPLIDSEGQLRGVLAFVFAAHSSDTREPEVGRLSTIAELTAQTVERAMLYLHEHELVVNLQRQTLADLPAVDGLDMAARYLPSAATLGLGGDWYDAYVLDDGRIGLVVGDVSGHGIDAIADMTEFRTTISTLLRTNQDLGMLTARSTALLNDDRSSEVRFATASLMIVDVPAHQMSYVRAGHPPMVIRTVDGEVIMLEAGGGGPIGISAAGIPVQTVQIASGSVIVAYTDGLIERREEAIDVGLERLRSALAECPAPAVEAGADAIADVLIASCLGDRQTADDAALLVVVVQ